MSSNCWLIYLVFQLDYLGEFLTFDFLVRSKYDALFPHSLLLQCSRNNERASKPFGSSINSLRSLVLCLHTLRAVLKSFLLTDEALRPSRDPDSSNASVVLEVADRLALGVVIEPELEAADAGAHE